MGLLWPLVASQPVFAARGKGLDGLKKALNQAVFVEEGWEDRRVSRWDLNCSLFWLVWSRSVLM